MSGRPNTGFPNDSTLPLLAAFVLALAFLGGVVAVGLSDGADGRPPRRRRTRSRSSRRSPRRASRSRSTRPAAARARCGSPARSACAPRECNFEMDRETSVTIIARAAEGSKFVTLDRRMRRRAHLHDLHGPLAHGRPRCSPRRHRLPPPVPTADCRDGLDNDSDGFPDDADPECFTGDTEAGDEGDPLLDDGTLPAEDPTPAQPVAPPPVVPPPGGPAAGHHRRHRLRPWSSRPPSTPARRALTRRAVVWHRPICHARQRGGRRADSLPRAVSRLVSVRGPRGADRRGRARRRGGGRARAAAVGAAARTGRRATRGRAGGAEARRAAGQLAPAARAVRAARAAARRGPASSPRRSASSSSRRGLRASWRWRSGIAAPRSPATSPTV